MPVNRTSPSSTIGGFVRFLLPDGADLNKCPVWPPDLFAITGSILRRTGGYLRALDFAANLPAREVRRRLWADAAEAGRTWRITISDGLRSNGRLEQLEDWMQPRIAEWWSVIAAHMSDPLAQANQDNEVTRTLIALTIAADEACLGIGIDHALRAKVARNERKDDPFLAAAQALLFRNHRRSLCDDVAIDRIAVLGKQHTAQRGLTLRSLSHNLALYPATEIVARWAGPYSQRDTPDIINLLLLPWPLEVSANDFRVQDGPMGQEAAPQKYRYFEYQPTVPSIANFERRMRDAVERARREAVRIDAIVLPELALSWQEYLVAEQVAIENQALLISGVRVGAEHMDSGGPVNACCVQPLGLTPIAAQARRAAWLESMKGGLRLVQRKHHRWCLDRGQILQYELGGRLPASKECWEYIDIGERAVNFMTLGTWLTWSVLICEDLARQDPVVDVLRAVGPNLVIALLMDGPQLRNRWPSRYASVLAEDPGSSVLTLTSLGMCSRSKAKPGDVERPRTIALWKDVRYGEQEITLPEGADGCVLSLVCRSVSEYTADGRKDDDQAHYPVFAGVHPLLATSGKRRARRKLAAPRTKARRVASKVFDNQLGDELAALLALAAVRRHRFLDEEFLMEQIQSRANKKIAAALKKPPGVASGLSAQERSYLSAIEELAGTNVSESDLRE